MILGVYLNTLGSIGDKSGYGDPASNIIIGGYDLNYSSAPNELFYVNLKPVSSTLQFQISNLILGNSSVPLPNTFWVIDMKVPYIYLDYSSYYLLLNSPDLNSCFDSNFIQCRYDQPQDKFPDFVMSFDGVHNITIKGQKIWKFSQSYSNGDSTLYYYFLLITRTSLGYSIIGNIALREYYTIYDIENLRIGFAPSLGSSKYTGLASIILLLGSF
jgi:Eukaryotic aspartyl protease